MVDPSLEGTFTDISNHWAKDDILMATGLGLFRGMTDSTFCPQTPLSRGQLVTVLYRMEGSPEVTGSSGFQDVAPNQYYTQAVAWAKENGLVTASQTPSSGLLIRSPGSSLPPLCTVTPAGRSRM